MKYPPEVINKLLDNQVLQGNKRDESIFEEDIEAHKEDGGVNWTETSEGEDFWHKVLVDKDFKSYATFYPITVKGWLEILPTDIKLEVLRLTIDKDYLNDHAYSFRSALQGCFRWSSTPQKFNYWSKIATKYN